MSWPLLVLRSGAQIQPVLKRVDNGADEGTDRDGELDEAGLDSIEAVILAEGLDHR